MAVADCETCQALGFRACDRCGTPICEDGEPDGFLMVVDAFGREFCELCAYGA